MRTVTYLCAAAVLAPFTAAIAAPFDPQDSQVILTDTSTDRGQNKKRVQKSAASSSSREVDGSDANSYFTANSTNDEFSTNATGFIPVCLELQGAHPKCDSSQFKCISDTKIDLINGISTSVNTWSIYANNGFSLFWKSSAQNVIELQTGGNAVTTTGTSPAIQTIADANHGAFKATVEVNNSQSQDFNLDKKAILKVHYCQVDSTGKPNCVDATSGVDQCAAVRSRH